MGTPGRLTYTCPLATDTWRLVTRPQRKPRLRVPVDTQLRCRLTTQDPELAVKEAKPIVTPIIKNQQFLTFEQSITDGSKMLSENCRTFQLLTHGGGFITLSSVG